MKVTFGIPVIKLTFSDFWISLLQRLNEVASCGYAVEIAYGVDKPLTVARQKMLMMALDNGSDRFISVDTDQLIQKDVLPILIKSEEAMTCANYVRTSKGHVPVAVKDGKPVMGNTIPIEIDSIGLGCAVVNLNWMREIKDFRKMLWFYDEVNADGLVCEGDINFCKLIKKNGGRVVLYPLRVGHCGAVV